MLFDRNDCCPDMMEQPSMMPYDSFDGMDCRCGRQPIVETPIQRCIQREICHEVQHICPIHTRIINNHIFRHTYVPQHTCSEENVCSNIDQGSCCNFL